MAQSMPGGTSLPQLSSDQMRELLNGPTLKPVEDIRPGQCTKDDPMGTKSNGTPGRVYTQELRSYDPKAGEAQRKAMQKVQACASSPFACAAVQFMDNFDVQSAKASVQSGPVKVTADSEKGFSAEAKSVKPGKDGKVDMKPKVTGEVCIVKKGDTKKDGSWFTYEAKFRGITNRAGFPDGNWCLGYDGSTAPSFKAWTP